MGSGELDTTAGAVVGTPVPDDAELDALRAWAPAQRWFPAKGSDARLERLAVVDLTDPDGEAPVRLHLLALPTGAVLQVPTTRRPVGTDVAGAIGVVDGALLVDGPHDPAFVRAWLAVAHDDGSAPRRIGTPRVVAGEQSNTSVLLPQADRPGILKVFRVVTPGPNPDVEVPLALSRAGWTGVPRPLAWLAGAWRPGDDDAVGHLGVLSALVQGARDGFELACDHARAGQPFGDLAEDLGRTTAQMHAALRAALPVPAGAEAGDEVARVVATLRERADAAAGRVPELAARAAAVHAAYDRLAALPAVPPLQRVHGDYHLGQVLRSSGTGGERWYVLDFEGEPQASAAEKTRPDLALRDVAGMLRSLDYAAAVGGAQDASWLPDARGRLIAGYQSETGGVAAGLDVILPALELDKALYEVVYESGNRPDWVSIPLAGVDRLLGLA
jgi:maltokinase